MVRNTTDELQTDAEGWLLPRSRYACRRLDDAGAGCETPTSSQKVEQVRDVEIAVLSLGGFYSPSSTAAAATLYGQMGPVVTVDGTQDTFRHGLDW